MSTALHKRDVFSGNSGLILLGLLSGFGTLFVVLVIFILILWLRKRHRNRRIRLQPTKSYINHSSRISEETRHVETEEPMQQVSSPLQPAGMRFDSQDFPRSPGGSGQWVPSSFVPGAAGPGQVPPHLKRHRTEPGRPTSYLPGVRSFTPLALSMPFVNAASSPSPAGRALTPEGTPQRPGMPSMPSSDLLPAQDEAARDQEDPFYSSEDLHAELSHDDGATTSYASSTDAKAYSHPMKSKYNPRYLSYSQTYQYPSNQAQPSAPFFGTAGNEAAAYRASGKHRLSSHLRNRSSGTVMTSSSSNATTRIRPVFFNDSPSSSIGASSLRYQPSEPYLEDLGRTVAADASGSSEGETAKNRSKSSSSSKATKARHRLSASPPVQSSSSSTPYSSDPPDPGQVSDQSITSLAKNFVFPAPPTMQRHSTAPEVVTRREVLKSVPSGRRISGKLPDSWFGGAPEQTVTASSAGKGKARMVSQSGIVGNFEDEEQDDGELSFASTDRQDRDDVAEQEQREVARPESELLAISSAQKQKGSLVQQPSFTSVASTGDVSSSSHYGHAM